MSEPLILDGKWLASQYHKRIQREVLECQEQNGRPPGLGVLLVGDNPASRAYVGMKERVATRKCGFKTFDRFLPESAAAKEVIGVVEEFNRHPEIDGILVQLPLPSHLDSAPVLDLILPEKDADGLHPLNQGLVMRGDGSLIPCTPLGCMKLIDFAFSEDRSGDATEITEADLSGFNAVVVGRSLLVGKPVAQLLIDRNATVTQVHSRTESPETIALSADILVVAAGRAGMVNEKWVKKGAVVIDVGINRTDSGGLTGDVDYEAVAPLCRAITPVPGGVGPMTVAMLMHNTLTAYKKRFSNI